MGKKRARNGGKARKKRSRGGQESKQGQPEEEELVFEDPL